MADWPKTVHSDRKHEPKTETPESQIILQSSHLQLWIPSAVADHMQLQHLASDHDITPEDTPSTTQIQFLLVASRRFAAIYMGLVWANNFAFKHEKAHERCSPLSSELVFTQVSRTCRLRRMPISAAHRCGLENSCARFHLQYSLSL